MGAEVYCLACGGPLTNHGSVIKDSNVLRRLLAKLKEKDRYWALENTHADNMISDLAYKNIIDPQEEQQLKKKITHLNKVAKYKWLEKCIILTRDGGVKKITTVDSWDRLFKDASGEKYAASFLIKDQKDLSARYKPMHDPNSRQFFGDGYVLHQACYQVLKPKYGSFTLSQISLRPINHGMIKKYQGQDVSWQMIFYDDNEFILENPTKNTKNKNRILKINLPITKKGREIIIKKPRRARRRKVSRRKVSRKVSRRKISRRKVSRRKVSRRKVSRRKVSRRKVSRRKVSRKKRKVSRKISQKVSRKVSLKVTPKKLKFDRPSPPESATLFPVGFRKKGNDGNLWEIIRTKNGVQRWKRLRF